MGIAHVTAAPSNTISVNALGGTDSSITSTSSTNSTSNSSASSCADSSGQAGLALREAWTGARREP